MLSLIFTFFYSCMTEKVLRWVKFLKWRFSWIYMLRCPLNPKTNILRLVCVCVCHCAFYQHNYKTNYAMNSDFSILQLYHMKMLHETVYEDRMRSLCKEGKEGLF